MKKSFAQIMDGVLRDRTRRLSAKLPQWAEAGDIDIPDALCLEQCSSSAAAKYKASVIAGALSGQDATADGPRVADLTGGLGVDSWALSAVCSRILYNERSEALACAARHNFALLGVTNADFSCRTVAPGALDFVRAFAPNAIYLDPARRDAAGRKVFLPEQCTPDILSMQDELLGICPHVFVKLSPMADLSLLRARFGAALTAMHVISLDGECKEILCHLRSGAGGLERITAVSLTGTQNGGDTGATMTFSPEDMSVHCAVAGQADEAALRGQLLFEPGAALMKSGCHDSMAARRGWLKLGRSTHLYLCPEHSGAQASAISSTDTALGRLWRIEHVFPLDKRGLREAAQACPQADVSARDIPMSSEQLASRLGIRSSGGPHIFGVSAGPDRTRLLLVCTKPEPASR